jgi:hypothetical protein
MESTLGAVIFTVSFLVWILILELLFRSKERWKD